jgi:hypothetical protein
MTCDPWQPALGIGRAERDILGTDAFRLAERRRRLDQGRWQPIVPG